MGPGPRLCPDSLDDHEHGDGQQESLDRPLKGCRGHAVEHQLAEEHAHEGGPEQHGPVEQHLPGDHSLVDQESHLVQGAEGDVGQDRGLGGVLVQVKGGHVRHRGRSVGVEGPSEGPADEPCQVAHEARQLALRPGPHQGVVGQVEDQEHAEGDHEVAFLDPHQHPHSQRRSDEQADHDPQQGLPLDVPDEGDEQVEHDRQPGKGDQHAGRLETDDQREQPHQDHGEAEPRDPQHERSDNRQQRQREKFQPAFLRTLQLVGVPGLEVAEDLLVAPIVHDTPGLVPVGHQAEAVIARGAPLDLLVALFQDLAGEAVIGQGLARHPEHVRPPGGEVLFRPVDEALLGLAARELVLSLPQVAVPGPHHRNAYRILHRLGQAEVHEHVFRVSVRRHLHPHAGVVGGVADVHADVVHPHLLLQAGKAQELRGGAPLGVLAAPAVLTVTVVLTVLAPIPRAIGAPESSRRGDCRDAGAQDERGAHPGLDLVHGLSEEAGAVLEAAAVAVGALVGRIQDLGGQVSVAVLEVDAVSPASSTTAADSANMSSMATSSSLPSRWIPGSPEG